MDRPRKPQPPKRRASPKTAASKPLAEELAHDAVAHEKPAAGDRVEIRVRLRKPVAEALTARAVREEKNLSALAAEILEAATTKDKA